MKFAKKNDELSGMISIMIRMQIYLDYNPDPEFGLQSGSRIWITIRIQDLDDNPDLGFDCNPDTGFDYNPDPGFGSQSGSRI